MGKGIERVALRLGKTRGYKVESHGIGCINKVKTDRMQDRIRSGREVAGMSSE